MAKPLPSSKVLNYSVHASSGHSASYTPANVRVNQPTDQASRWSSASNDLNQFLTLKLDRMAVLESIGFGKFHKVHVCNLKEFKVLAGPTLDDMHLILHTGLNNDTQPESFPPNYSLAHLPPFPVQFVKIVPLAAWGSNFNFSIWYIELKGWEDSINVTCDHNNNTSQLVQAAWNEYKREKEIQTTRLVLKFLRQHPEHHAAFSSLQTSSGIQLEAPVVTQLHGLLAQNHLKEAEQLLVNLYTHDPHIFDQYLHEHIPYTVHWQRIEPQMTTTTVSMLDENGDYRMLAASGSASVDDTQNSNARLVPSARGGHQMIWSGTEVFLLGGWDGKKDLADFWSFNPQTQSWKLISMNVASEGGPSARSCHKAALNASTGHIYILGRYIDPEKRDPMNLPCDFYRYSIPEGTWTRLSADVRAEGGPGCIYDHQMVVDEEENCIWVFGGRLLSGTNEHSVYSGLYRCDLSTLQWTLLQGDLSDSAGVSVNSSVNANTHSVNANTQSTQNTLNAQNTPLPPIKVPSRIGHSMLLDPTTRSLLILAGQRYKDQLADFYTYSLDRHAVTQICKNLQSVGGPEPGFTQRASLDLQSREMFVFSSSIRSGSSGTNNPVVGATPDADYPAAVSDPCTFWVLDLERNKWTKISCESQNVDRPCPRFAHQIVYDPVGRTHYLFGGNPGNPADPSARLADFWCARLTKSQTPADLLRRCQYLIRRAQFASMTGDIPAALRYLQTDLAAVVDHQNPQESESFRALSAQLFLKPTEPSVLPSSMSIFDDIVKFLPTAMQPPHSSL